MIPPYAQILLPPSPSRRGAGLHARRTGHREWSAQAQLSKQKGYSDTQGRLVRPRLVLLTCCTALFIASMNAAPTNVALPSIREGLGASAAQLQWIVDAYTLVLGTLLLASSIFADRFGRRLAFIIGPSLSSTSVSSLPHPSAGQ